jgi:hypothetical protein
MLAIAEGADVPQHGEWIGFSENDVKGRRLKRECQAARPRIPSTR